MRNGDQKKCSNIGNRLKKIDVQKLHDSFGALDSVDYNWWGGGTTSKMLRWMKLCKLWPLICQWSANLVSVSGTGGTGGMSIVAYACRRRVAVPVAADGVALRLAWHPAWHPAWKLSTLKTLSHAHTNNTNGSHIPIISCLHPPNPLLFNITIIIFVNEFMENCNSCFKSINILP